jgi:transcriptional regulator with XRE-family HTH domain
MAPTDKTRRKALGDFIRTHRERLQPAMFGLDPGVRRRTPGLRREELAQLSGVSATWYSWIEQGRDLTVSATALARLARVLRLSPAERAYLFDLAGRRDPQAPDASAEADLPDGLRTMLDAITAPAYLLDRAWNAIAWNVSATELFAGWLDRPPPHNLLRFLFLDPAARPIGRSAPAGSPPNSAPITAAIWRRRKCGRWSRNSVRRACRSRPPGKNTPSSIAKAAPAPSTTRPAASCATNSSPSSSPATPTSSS